MFGIIGDFVDSLNLDVKFMTASTDAFVAMENISNSVSDAISYIPPRASSAAAAETKTEEQKAETKEQEIAEKVASSTNLMDAANVLVENVIEGMVAELPEELRDEAREEINKLPDKSSIMEVAKVITLVAMRHATNEEKKEFEPFIKGMDFSNCVVMETETPQPKKEEGTKEETKIKGGQNGQELKEATPESVDEAIKKSMLNQ